MEIPDDVREYILLVVDGEEVRYDLNPAQLDPDQRSIPSTEPEKRYAEIPPATYIPDISPMDFARDVGYGSSGGSFQGLPSEYSKPPTRPG